MTVWARLLLALALLGERIAALLQRLADQEWARKQTEQVEQLRDDSIRWWQDNFGTADVGDDRRLSDAAREVADAPAAPPHHRAD